MTQSIRGGIIDSHIHMFPPEIYRNWAHYAKRDSWFELLTREPAQDKGTKEAWSDAAETLACMESAGVSEVVMQGWYWNDPGLMRYHNDYMAELIRDYPGKMHGFISVNPTFGDAALYEIERCKSLGFSGIGELGPGGNGYDFTAPAFLDVVECAGREKLPLCIHCGEAVSHAYPGKDTTPLGPLADVIRTHQDQTFILAHLGGGMPFFEYGRRYFGRFKRVYYDMAANPLLYKIQVIPQIIAMIGDKRLLFGSDFPLLLYPGKCRERDMTLFVEDVCANAGLGPDALQAVLHDNMARILKEKR